MEPSAGYSPKIFLISPVNEQELLDSGSGEFGRKLLIRFPIFGLYTPVATEAACFPCNFPSIQGNFGGTGWLRNALTV